MSLLHDIIFFFIKKGQKPYNPNEKMDYQKARKNEEEGVPQNLPRKVLVKDIELDDVEGEFLYGEDNPRDKCIIYIHGGGFVGGSTKTVRPLTGELVKRLKRNIYSIHYRLAPEHPFPAAPEDCFKAYYALERKYGGENIILMGESAGGNLVLATALRAKAEGMTPPKCVIAMAPTVQFDQEFPSYTENLKSDCMVSNLCEQVQDIYLQSKDLNVLRNPYVAPYYGDFEDFPPTFLIVSDSEVLRDDALMLYEKLQNQNVKCKLSVYHNMMHIFEVIPSLPESKRAYKEIEDFIDEIDA